MTAKPERLVACSYATESAWAETTDAWGIRLQLIGQPTVALTQDRIAEVISQQYAEEGKAGVLGIRGGSVTIVLALTGHGGTTAGALTETDLSTLLRNFFGGGNVDEVGDTVAAAPTSSSVFDATSESYDSRNLIRVGVLGDGRCEGQWAAINDGATMTMLTALPATPDAGDQIYVAQNIHPNEGSNMSDITSLRMLVQTANNQYKLRGLFPQSASFSGLNPGEQPQVSLTYGVSWWDFANEAFPNATVTDAKDGSVCGNGSAWINDVGTLTRAAYSMRNWALTINMETAELHGPDAVNACQIIVGARRTKCSAELTTTFDAEASGTTTWADKFDAGTLQHLLIGVSVADGKAIAFYLQNAEITSRPTQEATDGLNRVTCNWRALTGTSVTSERNMSSWRMALG